MKTLTIIFAIAVMAVAFNVTPSHAAGESKKESPRVETRQEKYEKEMEKMSEQFGECMESGNWENCSFGQSSDGGNERDVADSGNEGSTSAAAASDR